MVPKRNIKSLSLEALSAWVAERGHSPFRARQLLQWLYQKQAASFADMTSLSKDFQRELSEAFGIPQWQPEQVQVSSDGTKKFLFRLEDGYAIESVLIPAKDRLTLCFSSQVGCAMGCDFCLTATMGLKRNLTLFEITEQIATVMRTLEPGKRLSNLVAMGMGEPLHNRKTLTEALRLLIHQDAFALSPNHITVSTSGLVPEIPKLLSDVPIKLAVSLNATTDAVRDKVMPVNRKYPLAVLLEACRALPLRRKGRVTFEYVMLHGVNDTPEDLKRLPKLLAHIPSKINLIPFNDYPGSPYKRPPDAWVKAFQNALLDKGFVACVRVSRGRDILGACGQLAAVGALTS